MDAIGFAMQKSAHISGMTRLQKQFWEDFDKEAAGKKVIVFGTGVCLSFYLEKYQQNARIDAVIDNDEKKQGYLLNQIVPEAFGIRQADTVISNASILKRYLPDEAVILVASINYYNDILEQLNAYGMTNCFVILVMEANYRITMQQKEAAKREWGKKRQFADICCQKNTVDAHKVFFRTYGKYTDHQKYITEALLKLREDLDIVWEVSDLAEIVPDGIRKVYSGNWTQCIYEMETSKIWVLDLPTPDYIIKRPEQLYLQTKHWASITLKKFYLDAGTFQSVPEKIENWKRDGRLIDYIITGSDFDTDSCRRGFGFQKEALQFGSPRSDALFHEKENREKVYDYYRLAKERRSVIYAPTYRFDKEKGKNVHESRNIELDFEAVKSALEKRFGGEWYILMRLHPSVATALADVQMPDFAVDVSSWADSQELVSAADMMISDYSSIMFEPAFVKKPVFLFATDLQDYLENEYELLIPYEELPFPMAETNAELEKRIMEFDSERYRSNLEAFLERYGVHEDGHASERVAAFISEYIS